MANENFADTVDKLKGIFDVTNMISTFGEVALITKKVQTHVKKPKVSFYLITLVFLINEQALINKQEGIFMKFQ